MKYKTLLRIASVLMLLHTIGHSIGALTWKEAPEPRLNPVISSMLSEKFVFLGTETSYGRFYSGFGISMIFVLAFVSLLLWMLSNNPVKNLLWLTGGLLASLAITEFLYFFPLPAIFSSVSALLTVAAVYRLRENEAG